MSAMLLLLLRHRLDTWDKALDAEDCNEGAVDGTSANAEQRNICLKESSRSRVPPLTKSINSGLWWASEARSRMSAANNPPTALPMAPRPWQVSDHSSARNGYRESFRSASKGRRGPSPELRNVSQARKGSPRRKRQPPAIGNRGGELLRYGLPSVPMASSDCGNRSEEENSKATVQRTRSTKITTTRRAMRISHASVTPVGIIFSISLKSRLLQRPLRSMLVASTIVVFFAIADHGSFAIPKWLFNKRKSASSGQFSPAKC